MIKFHNATDLSGKTVHINDVTRENRAAHYYCVGCGGEMSPVLGEKREHHFRHKEAHCSWESYLHKLGKIRLKERFDSQKEFVIKYRVEFSCDKEKGCTLAPIYKQQPCNCRELFTVDLKKLYDTCEEEVTYKGYRADLMLTHSEHPEREPLFLEISVTHDCEPEKLASGIQIIELKIADEKDVLRPLVEEESLFISNEEDTPYAFDALPPVRFYNFKRNFQTTRPLKRFWVSKDEKEVLRGNCIQDDLSCRNVGTNHRNDSLYEVAIPSEILVGNRQPNLYEFGLVKAVNKGLDMRHCGLCYLYGRCILNYTEEVTDPKTKSKRNIPRQAWMHKIPDQNLDKVAFAANCKKFSVNRSFMYTVSRRLNNLPCWEWKVEQETKAPF